MRPYFKQSIDLTFWLQSLGDWLDPVMHFFTFLGNEEFYLFVMPVFLWVLDYRLGFKLGVMLLLTSGINDLAKMIFRLPRPYWVDPSAGKVAAAPAGGYGLPSGHSQTSLSIFGLLAVEFKKRWVTIVGDLRRLHDRPLAHLPGRAFLFRCAGRLGAGRDRAVRLRQAGPGSQPLVQRKNHLAPRSGRCLPIRWG